MKFYDRTEQIQELQAIREQAFEKHSTLTIVTGRRRIGKTTLIEKAMGEGMYVYFLSVKKVRLYYVQNMQRKSAQN